jgi:hypothetical protein
MKINRSDLLALKELGYGEGCRYIESMHKREMAFRMKELQLKNKAEAEKAALEIGGELVDFFLNEATEWTVAFTPIKNVKIYFLFQRYSPEFEDEILTFYGRETSTTDIPIDDLYDFTRLYANALVRASKT